MKRQIRVLIKRNSKAYTQEYSNVFSAILLGFCYIKDDLKQASAFQFSIYNSSFLYDISTGNFMPVFLARTFVK